MRFITGLLFTFICLLPAGSMAQNKVTLSGKITDQHGTPVAQKGDNEGMFARSDLQ